MAFDRTEPNHFFSALAHIPLSRVVQYSPRRIFLEHHFEVDDYAEFAVCALLLACVTGQQRWRHPGTDY
jgi:hypothetical protein